MIKTVSPAQAFVQQEVIAETRQYHAINLDKFEDENFQPPLTDRRANYGFSALPIRSYVYRTDRFGANFWTIFAKAPMGDMVGSVSVSSKRLFSVFVILIQAAYGGIHMTAWHFAFPSPVERWLWCSVSIYIASFTPLFHLLIQSYDRIVDGSKYETLFVPLYIIYMVVSFLLSFCARIYIVIEAFIALRAVPVGVYEAIPWANYIPHI